MAKFDTAKAIFSQVDTNQDGSIDQNEFRNWTSNTNVSTPLSYNISTSGVILSGDTAGNARISRHEASPQSVFEFNSDTNTSYTTVAAAAAAAASERVSTTTIQTSSARETSEYLSRSGNDVFNDPNPRIIRRAAPQDPVTYQQRIFIRFFQPPPVPPPGPLIIKEVRPPQPPPPPPLVVRQRAPPLPSPPPLILRERPPVPLASVASQTIIRHLNAQPPPPRSVIVERLPPLPPKPRDVIIERWIPYGPQPKRRTIVQRAAAAVQYPQPRNIIVIYDTVQTHVVRQFQRLGVTQEDPQAYANRYGATLLDSATLIQQARTAGVIEDISPPSVSSSTQFNSSSSSSVGTERHSSAGYEFLNATNGQSFSPASTRTSFQGLRVISDLEPNVYNVEVVNNANTRYSSLSSSNFLGDSAFAGGVGIGNVELDVTTANFVAADSNRDGRLDRTEFQRFIRGGI